MTTFPGPPDRLVREAAWVARCVGRADTVPFTDADLDALASSLARREFREAGVLFTQAAPPAGVWIIQHGSVELAVRSGRRRAVVALLRPGDVEGDVALVLGKPPPYTARAREPTVCLFLDAADFRRLLRRHPAIAQRWLTSCAIRLARSHARILELLEGSLLQRVARLLLDEAVDGHVLLPQRTLAAMLGVHRQSFNKDPQGPRGPAGHRRGLCRHPDPRPRRAHPGRRRAASRGANPMILPPILKRPRCWSTIPRAL